MLYLDFWSKKWWDNQFVLKDWVAASHMQGSGFKMPVPTCMGINFMSSKALLQVSFSLFLCSFLSRSPFPFLSLLPFIYWEEEKERRREGEREKERGEKPAGVVESLCTESNPNDKLGGKKIIINTGGGGEWEEEGEEKEKKYCVILSCYIWGNFHYSSNRKSIWSARTLTTKTIHSCSQNFCFIITTPFRNPQQMGKFCGVAETGPQVNF